MTYGNAKSGEERKKFRANRNEERRGGEKKKNRGSRAGRKLNKEPLSKQVLQKLLRRKRAKAGGKKKRGSP